MRVATAAALAICGGLVVVYIFFWAFGAFSLGDALAATIVVLIRPLLGGVACSPPLTAEQEHIDLIAQAIRHGLDRLGDVPPKPDESSGG